MVDVTSWFRGRRPEEEAQSEASSHRRAHIIVLGNEKGGSGKTTTTMHLVVALLRLGFKVGTMDIDARQRSLSRYIENRHKTMKDEDVSLPVPHHIVITKSPFNVREEAEQDERERFEQGMERILDGDFIIVDSPGNDTYLSRLAHSYADTVITPINDSFVDLDVLATVDANTMKVIRPSIYSEMVWEQKLERAKRDGGSTEWVVMRNRLSNLDARNKRFMTKAVEELSRRIGFRLAPGFSERVIYREMFLQGLTVLDVMDMSKSKSISMSHLAARQEVRDLLGTLRIPEIDRRINDIRRKEEGLDDEEEQEAQAVASADEAPTVEPGESKKNEKATEESEKQLEASH
jgi:chromosome partitioning protein